MNTVLALHALASDFPEQLLLIQMLVCTWLNIFKRCKPAFEVGNIILKQLLHILTWKCYSEATYSQIIILNNFKISVLKLITEKNKYSFGN
jgi:hypothetical protein